MTSTTATTYQLYLGRHIDLFNREVSNTDFKLFIENEILPRFSAFSHVESIGYWKNKPEKVFVVTIISEDYYDAVDINRIAESYKEKFLQEAVLVNTFSSFPNVI